MLKEMWLGNDQAREPASSDRLPGHRSESPTGYSSAGCSPAEPASASPITDNGSSIPSRQGQSNAPLNLIARMHYDASEVPARWARSSRESVSRCRVRSAGGVISTLRDG